MNVVNIDGIELFNSMYPNFFGSVKNLPDDAVYEEMLLPLGDRISHIKRISARIFLSVFIKAKPMRSERRSKKWTKTG